MIRSTVCGIIPLELEKENISQISPKYVRNMPEIYRKDLTTTTTAAASTMHVHVYEPAGAAGVRGGPTCNGRSCATRAQRCDRIGTAARSP